jgi:drug/metabolite transporter (DMT)-like permease
MAVPTQHRGKALAFILGAILLANMQDVVVKDASATLPAWEVIIFRTVVAFPFLMSWMWRQGTWEQMFGRYWVQLFARSIILCSAYFGFVLAASAMPLATAVSIYFTMPFFVAGLSGYMLGERVPSHRWLAIAVGFAGVLMSVRPTPESVQPAVLFALYSAFGYAWGQMLGRKLSHLVAPEVIANWQNLTYLASGIIIGLFVVGSGIETPRDPSLSFLLRPWVWPDARQIGLLVFMGITAAVAVVFFIHAYKNAEASFVAPFEYSAIIWATLFGIVFFGDFPDGWNVAGTCTVIAAGLFMLWMDRRGLKG